MTDSTPPAATPSAPAAPVSASVLFLRIREFAQLPLADQASRREALMATVHTLLPQWHEDARVVLEAPDGAAIVSLTGPLRALQAARLLVGDGTFGVALHYGAVQALRDMGIKVLTGDGVDTARAVAGRPGTRAPSVTREFRRALLAVAPEQAPALRLSGDFLDERLRSYELFEVDLDAERRYRRRRLLVIGGAVAGIVGLGVAARVVRRARGGGRR